MIQLEKERPQRIAVFFEVLISGQEGDASGSRMFPLRNSDFKLIEPGNDVLRHPWIRVLRSDWLSQQDL